MWVYSTWVDVVCVCVVGCGIGCVWMWLRGCVGTCGCGGMSVKMWLASGCWVWLTEYTGVVGEVWCVWFGMVWGCGWYRGQVREWEGGVGLLVGYVKF